MEFSISTPIMEYNLEALEIISGLTLKKGKDLDAKA
jgi:hypothetical protein